PPQSPRRRSMHSPNSVRMHYSIVLTFDGQLAKREPPLLARWPAFKCPAPLSANAGRKERFDHRPGCAPLEFLARQMRLAAPTATIERRRNLDSEGCGFGQIYLNVKCLTLGRGARQPRSAIGAGGAFEQQSAFAAVRHAGGTFFGQANNVLQGLLGMSKVPVAVLAYLHGKAEH